MQTPNNPPGANDGLFSGLLQLQTEFYTRLTEETFKYLRRLQGAAAPAVPATVFMPGSKIELAASGFPGASVDLKLEIENRQRVHCVVTPMFTPLVSSTGVVWFPTTDSLPPLMLLAPEEIKGLVVELPLPANIPPGIYRGALLLLGLSDGTMPVAITARDVTPGKQL